MNNYIVPAKGKRIASVGWVLDIIAALSTYACIVPFFFLDVCIWQFQNIYFRIMEIPMIDRRKYVIIDRYKLWKLTFWQKLNCVYCEYANGIVWYAKAVVNQMEVYSCAIKHAHHPLGQEHQVGFFDREDFQ